MSHPFLPDFVARWTQLQERYRANPGDVVNTRLVRAWRRQGGLCHICGGRVPHPLFDLELVTAENAPTCDHARPRADGGGRGKNLRLAHRFCNSRRGRAPLGKALRRAIRTEAAAIFGTMEIHG
jgi:hypothetical protein